MSLADLAELGVVNWGWAVAKELPLGGGGTELTRSSAAENMLVR